MIDKLEEDVLLINKKITAIKGNRDYSAVTDKKIEKLEAKMLEILSEILEIEKKIDKRLG